MTFKFITLKDPHLSFGFQNRIRKNYELHVSNKLNFVREYAKDHNIINCIFTGDVFDSSKEDKWSFKKYRKNKRVLEDFKQDGLMLFSNVGNHDMFHGYEDSDDTIFGEMTHDNILSNITNDPIRVVHSGKSLIIQGIDYSHNLDIVRDYIQEVNDNAFDFKVCILHSNVTPDVVDKITDFTYDSLAKDYPNIDCFILGHYHVGYPTRVVERADGSKVTFINNWNFTRVVRDYETELDEHTPEFEEVIINYNDQTGVFSILCTTIPVPAVTYNETFHSKDIEIIKKSRQEILKFFETINFSDIKKDSKLDDADLIKQIQKKHSFSDSAVSTALEYLNDSKD